MSTSNDPTSSRGRLAGLVAGIYVVLAPTSASADVEEPIALRYESNGACPTEAEFMTSVRSHTTRWTRVPDGTALSRTMHVVVSVGPSETTGRLVVGNARGVVSERDIAGPSCAAVSRALAMMVAVAIDPAADMAGDATAGGTRESTQSARNVSLRSEPMARAPRSSPRDALRVALDLRAETTSAVVRGASSGSVSR